MVVKICRWTGRFCSFNSCSFLDSLGNVCLCKYHGHSKGLFSQRKRGVGGVAPAVLSPSKFVKRGVC